MAKDSWRDKHDPIHLLKSRADRDLDAQVTYEQAAVMAILRKTGLGHKEQGLRDSHPAGHLTLAILTEELNFPMWLVAKKLPAADTLALFVAMTKKPEKTKLWREFTAIFEDIPPPFSDIGVAGLVFQLGSFSKFMVFHNREPSELGNRGWFFRAGDDRRLYFLEQLTDLLDGLGLPDQW